MCFSGAAFSAPLAAKPRPQVNSQMQSTSKRRLITLILLSRKISRNRGVDTAIATARLMDNEFLVNTANGSGTSLRLVGLDQIADALRVGFAMAVDGDGIRAAAAFDSNTRP